MPRSQVRDTGGGEVQQASDEPQYMPAAVETSPLPAINPTRGAVVQYSGDA
jgi:hypothetical protein